MFEIICILFQTIEFLYKRVCMWQCCVLYHFSFRHLLCNPVHSELDAESDLKWTKSDVSRLGQLTYSTFNINIPGHISPPEKIFYPEDIDETLRPFKCLPLCDSQRMQFSPFNKCSCPSFHSVWIIFMLIGSSVTGKFSLHRWNFLSSS